MSPNPKPTPYKRSNHKPDCKCNACRGSQGLKRVTLWLPEDIVQQLKERSEKHGDQKRMVEEALRQYFSE